MALAREGIPASAIVRKVQKKDKTHPSVRAVQATIAKAKADVNWRGENVGGPGRSCALTPLLRRRLVCLVFKERGATLVTVKYCTQKIPSLRRVSRWCVARNFHAAGLVASRRCDSMPA